MPHSDPSGPAVPANSGTGPKPAMQRSPKPSTAGESAPDADKQPGQDAREISGWAMGDSPVAE